MGRGGHTNEEASELDIIAKRPAIVLQVFALSRSAAGGVGCSTETGSDAGKVSLRASSSALISRARKLCVSDNIGLELADTVYALDSTTIDLCLSPFPWADFRSTKAAVKMHTLLDLRGPIPSFIHISDGKMGDAAALDLIMPEAGAIYVMDRGYVDFCRLYVIHQAGAFFVTRTKVNMK